MVRQDVFDLYSAALAQGGFDAVPITFPTPADTDAADTLAAMPDETQAARLVATIATSWATVTAYLQWRGETAGYPFGDPILPALAKWRSEIATCFGM